MTPKHSPDRGLAVEQQLRDALDRAWAEYTKAPREEKTHARERYLTALRRFTEYVTRG